MAKVKVVQLKQAMLLVISQWHCLFACGGEALKDSMFENGQTEGACMAAKNAIL
ncbi:hypothetical protein AAG897_04890 [Lacticaseibacillus rhamnosus]|uniref:hypothetical protein n=1 Tax=Lacticaseibacillus rhamnosus TaxID=47715 RepID=UPI0012DB32A2|nr:hypothetical protein [Lacticaseibacillus rhamnosus]